ncbi:MAG: tetratricopeptide repeat protein [Candidatus Aminicenantes bacterium]|nr:tetratricopeptide repeat protein [Candidatus Aminicenantes bacterium]
MNQLKTNKCLNIINLFLFFLLITAFITSTYAQEQMGKGRINGIIINEKGEPVEGALILVESTTTDTSMQGKSDDKGHFAVAGLGSGFWQVTASKKGYNSSSIKIDVHQLSKNPALTLTLTKMDAFAAILTDEEALQMFDKGNLLLREEKYDEALAIFTEFQQNYPDIHQVHLNLGNCYLKKGDWETAEAEFNLVLDKTLENYGDYIKDKATSLRAFAGLGEVYLQKQDFEKAREYLTKALEISPEDEVTAYNVGQLFFSNQRPDDAIKFYKLAVQIKADWPKPYLRLGYAYLNKSDFDHALENFNKFIEMDPDNPEVPQIRNIITTIEKMKK